MSKGRTFTNFGTQYYIESLLEKEKQTSSSFVGLCQYKSNNRGYKFKIAFTFCYVN